MNSQMVSRITVTDNGKTFTIEFSEPQAMTVEEIQAYGARLIQVLNPVVSIPLQNPYPFPYAPLDHKITVSTPDLDGRKWIISTPPNPDWLRFTTTSESNTPRTTYTTD